MPTTPRRLRPLIPVAAASCVATLLLAGCGGSAGTSSSTAAGTGSGLEVSQLRYQGSVGSVTYPELAEDLGYLGGLKLNWVGNTISGPQDIQSTQTGDIDVGGAFNGAVVKLIARGAPLKAVIGYYGTDDKTFQGFYVPDGSPIRSAHDFIGKKVGMNTLGAHAEAVLDEYLKQGGLSKDEIKQVVPTVVPPVSTEQALRAHQIDVAVLGGIIRDKALVRGGLTKVFSDFDLLGKFTAGSYVLRKDFIAKNPNTVRAFVTGTAKAIEWSQTQPRDVVVARFKAIIHKRGRKEDDSLVDFWKSGGVAQKGGVIDEKDISRWIDWLRVNGQLDRDVAVKDLYTNEFNDLATAAAG